MRKTLLLSVMTFGLAAAASAQTATPEIRPGHVPGVGQSLPLSNNASNITPGDTHSVIAPTLPAPAGGENASFTDYLRDAQRSLDERQTGRAEEALERAETAVLQRSVPVDQAGNPDQAPTVRQIEAARDALAHHDLNGAKSAVSTLLASAR